VETADAERRELERNLHDGAQQRLLTRIGAGAGRVERESRIHLASRAALMAAGSAAILILATAVMELDVERTAAKANITTFSDALWWAVSTITTVGYGDHYPVGPAGRAIGIALMIADVGIFGIVAASPAAWFISADEQQDRHQQAEAITTLTAEITALRQRAAELSAYLAAQAARPAKQRHTAAAPTTARRQRPPVPAPAIGGKARVRRQPSGRHAGPLTSTTFTRLPQQPTSRKALNRASSEQATWACAQIRPLGAAPAPTPADQH
jgi:hypothetical protein